MADRKRAERWGRRGESLAALALQLKGYRILAKRVRTPLGEIDLVAKQRDLLVFIEVKARKSVREALDAVTPRARKRIEAAAMIWCGRVDPAGRLGHRFDIVAVQPWRWPVHIREAWRPDFA